MAELTVDEGSRWKDATQGMAEWQQFDGRNRQGDARKSEFDWFLE
jgi:hypothetical protein